MSELEQLKHLAIDPKQFGKVAVLMGGEYSEREISLLSGQCVTAGLQAKGIDAHPVVVDSKIVSTLLREKFDRAFIALHGKGGEDGTIQGFLEYLNIPYTGSRVAASALAMDKIKAKQIWQTLNIKTPKYLVVNKETSVAEIVNAVGVPAVLKPFHEGSSLGVTLIDNETEILKAMQHAFEYDDYIMAETRIMGPEFTVGILAGHCLPTIHLSTKRKFYNFEAKYLDEGTGFHIPCGLESKAEKKLQEICLAVYKSIGCRHWARVDVMQDQHGEFWVLEINTIPGLTQHSLVPKMAKYIGIDFPQLMLVILAQTLAHEI